jgi:hypothetical protein
MKYSFSQIKHILEASKNYDAFLAKAMKKFKIKDIGSLDDKETTKFFNWIDKNWDAKNEEVEKVDEVLSIQGRRKLGRAMKKNAKKNARKRKISMNRKATPDKIRDRAKKAAIKQVKSSISGGKDTSTLSHAAKEALEKRLKKKSGLINKIARKLIPSVRAAEKERLANKNKK